MTRKLTTLTLLLIHLLFVACSSQKDEASEEQIETTTASESVTEADSLSNSVEKSLTMKEAATFPNQVILTGLNDYRLVSVYKSRQTSDNKGIIDRSYSYSEEAEEQTERFMPGIEILYGYNLLNIAHYDLKNEKMRLLFNHPVLVKTLYYPSFVQDSLNGQPVNRNYYLMSVYDEDTNKDNRINKKDLRHFYHFNADGSVKTRLLPDGYSAVHSQYDSGNDLMYIFARHDENGNGTGEKTEPMHVFWFSLKTPEKARFLYRSIY